MAIAVFAPAVGFDSVSYDDPQYFFENPNVQGGITRESVVWAFTSHWQWNWHPVTWLSHMLDVELYGNGRAGPHATNVALHAVNTVLVFCALLSLTRRRWPSAFTAALFALHPLHVESVAWISERKDLLSTTFGLIAIAAYAGYARRGGVGRYAIVFVALALGLMSKSMLVTLPCVFLLLDYWPLARLLPSAGLRFAEKLPLFALSAATAVVALRTQSTSIDASSELSLPERLANAVVSYALYLGKTVVPTDLAVLYPHPYLGGGAGWSGMQVALALFVLVAITGSIAALRRPYAWVGWLWFGGTLVPTIGLVQVGLQGVADRYTYLPSIGLFIVVCWGGTEIAERAPRWRPAVVGAGVAALLALTAATSLQLRVWQDSETLYRHALAVTDGNFVIHNNLGNVLLRRGDVDGAIEQYREAVRIYPDYPHGLDNLGQALVRRGDEEEGRGYVRRARVLGASSAKDHMILGAQQLQLGLPGEAAFHFALAAQLAPESAGIHQMLGHARRLDEDLAGAITAYRRALELAPRSSLVHQNLADVLLLSGQRDEALRHYERAVELEPGSSLAVQRLERARSGELPPDPISPSR